MPVGQAYRRFGRIAQKWCDLAERRCDQFVEIYRSGRWKRYCADEEEFALRMREVMSIADRWRQIAPQDGDDREFQPETFDHMLHRAAA